MIRQFYLDLAASGLRLPIGADLVLHEESDPHAVRNDGAALAGVIERAARRWDTSLAIPLMDLRLEKTDLLAMAGVPEDDAETYHFTSPMDEAALVKLCGRQIEPVCGGSSWSASTSTSCTASIRARRLRRASAH